MPRIYESDSAVYSPPEAKFLRQLQALDNSWVVFPHVWFWDSTFGEADFIVYHPDHGIVVVEVKGGSYSCVGGKWMAHHPNRDGWESVASPIMQAQQVYFKVSERVKQICPGPRPLVTWVLAFPTIKEEHCRIDKGIAPSNALLFDDGRSMELTLLRVLDPIGHAFRHHPFTPEQEQEFFRSLLPGGLFDEKPHARLDAHAALVEQESEPLRDMALCLASQKRMQVVGPPGSGKTTLGLAWLGTHKGNRGYLCYNRALSEWVRSQHSSDDLLEIRTFHDLGKVLIEAIDPEAWPKTIDSHFWSHEFLPLFEKALDQLGDEMDRFDYLVIDEGQDFDERWWPLVQRLVHPDGALLVLHDPQQSLRLGIQAEMDVLDLPPAIALSTVKRTPGAIVQWLQHELSPFSPDLQAWRIPQTSGLNNTAPHIIRCTAQRTSSDEVDRILQELRDKQIPSERIMVVTLRSREHSGLILRCPWAAWVGTRDTSKIVKVGSIMSLKGLEADVVLVVDWKRQEVFHDAVMRTRFITAVTRAKHSVYLFEDVA